MGLVKAFLAGVAQGAGDLKPAETRVGQLNTGNLQDLVDMGEADSMQASWQATKHAMPWPSMARHSIALRSIARHSTAQHSTASRVGTVRQPERLPNLAEPLVYGIICRLPCSVDPVKSRQLEGYLKPLSHPVSKDKRNL